MLLADVESNTLQNILYTSFTEMFIALSVANSYDKHRLIMTKQTMYECLNSA